MRHLNNVPDEMLQKITGQRRGRGTAGLRHNARALLNDHELQQHVLPHPGGENRGDAARECGELVGGHAEDELQFLIRDAVLNWRCRRRRLVDERRREVLQQEQQRSHRVHRYHLNSAGLDTESWFDFFHKEF